MNTKIGFLGAGEMAKAIAAVLPKGTQTLFSSRHDNHNADVARNCNIIFLAVRPAQVAEVAAEIRGILRKNQTLVSIVAGKSLTKLRKLFGRDVQLVRVMPNLALRAGAGMCVLTAPRTTPATVLDDVRAILEGAGRAVILPESAFDAVTALSGSGPAYFAFMEQAMSEGGVALGLKPEVARLLAEETMYGTAKFLRENKPDLNTFINGVATRGGTTEAGLKELARGPFKRAVARTLAAAATRSKELGK